MKISLEQIGYIYYILLIVNLEENWRYFLALEIVKNSKLIMHLYNYLKINFILIKLRLLSIFILILLKVISLDFIPVSWENLSIRRLKGFHHGSFLFISRILIYFLKEINRLVWSINLFFFYDFSFFLSNNLVPIFGSFLLLSFYWLILLILLAIFLRFVLVGNYNNFFLNFK